MLTILTKINTKNTIENSINSIDRLNELVTIVTEESQLKEAQKILVVSENDISASLDWDDTEPPYLFPDIEFSQENLLAMVFYKLGNHQKAFEFISEENSLHNHLLIATHLQFGYAINEDMQAFAKETSQHNNCIIEQYGNVVSQCDSNQLKALYTEALANASNDELRLFTIKHFVNFLLDANAYQEAEKILRLSLPKAISEASKNAINSLLANTLMAQLKMPYNTNKLVEIQELQQASIAFYEDKKLKVNAGLILIEASEIANFQEDFINSKIILIKLFYILKKQIFQNF
ncbi:hypothetical protein [Winogradskyella sp. MIT101101]|uniref:hypothetical protein n=1 Tax=Winogradskyella sp. MIT101101 TaxID=3098297 RepID=UPI00399B6B0D